MRLKFLLRGLDEEFHRSSVDKYPWIIKIPNDHSDYLVNFSNCLADDSMVYWIDYKLKKL